MGPIPAEIRPNVSLLERLEDCFKLFQGFSPDDRRRVQRLMTTLTQGMEMDLDCLPRDVGRRSHRSEDAG